MLIQDRLKVHEASRRVLWPVPIGAALLLALMWQLAEAADPVPAYVGGGIAWEYPANVANHTGFKLTINGVQGATQIPKAARQIAIADTILAAQPLGHPYTLNLIATATAPATNSLPAVLVVNYQASPRLAPPTNTRTILEWSPPQ